MSGEVITIERPDRAAIEASVSPLVAMAAGITVTDIASDARAQTYLGDLKRAEKQVDDKLGPIIADANRAHKGLTSLRAELLAPIAAARNIINAKLNAYQAEQRRIADAERLRLESEARRQEEARRKEDAARLAAEAKSAREAGDRETAKAIREERAAVLSEPIAVPMIHVAPQVAQVDGVSSRTTWGGECFDLVALARHVAEHPEDANLIAVNSPALNARARSQQGAMNIPGCRAVANTTRAVRAS